MTDLSKNIKFKNELRLKLNNSLTELIANSDQLQQIGGIEQIIQTCQHYNINSSNIRATDVALTEYASDMEEISRDAMGGSRDDVLSKIINVILGIVLDKIENPSIEKIAKLKDDMDAKIDVDTKDKTVSFSATPYSLKPFVRFNLRTGGSSQELVTLYFEIAANVELMLQKRTDDEDKKTPGITLTFSLSASLSEVGTPLGKQLVDLEFGGNEFEINLPFNGAR